MNPKKWHPFAPWPIWLGAATLAAAALGATLLAQAAGRDPDPERGQALATRWCAECHVVGPDTSGGDAGPAFESIAKTRSAESLRLWMAEPHPPMPPLDIPEDAARDIAAYILSLTDCRETGC